MNSGWTEIELSQVLKISNQKLGPHLEEPSVFAVSKYDGVILSSDFFGKRIASKNLDGYKFLNPGDWVYSTIHIDEGSIAVNHHPFLGVVSPMYTTMSWCSKDNLPEFFELLLRSPSAITTYGENAQGSVNRRRSLSFNRFAQLKFTVPALPEQKRIVDLISSVDSYVEALQQQIENAKRSRNAVLHELLTVGGEGWVETTLDGIAQVVMGQSPDGKSYNQEGKGLPFMQGSAEFGEHNPVPEKWCSDPKKIAEPGDLLLSVRAPVGDTNFADQRIAVGRGLSIIRANKESLTEFIRLVIQLNVAELIASSGSGMFASITGKNLKEFKVNLPPLPEQKRIVEIINTIDEVIAKTALTINKAKELRSGLLSDLLSGEHEIPDSYDKVIGAA